MEHFARQAHTKIKEDRAKGDGRTGEKKKRGGSRRNKTTKEQR